MTYTIKTLQQHLDSTEPKRILTLDGGGLRGILSLGYLAKIEKVLEAQHGGGDDFRLCHYFDLIAGTSTGAIIAAALALGMSVEQITAHYIKLGNKVFEKSLFRQGFFRAKYEEKKLSKSLRSILGSDRTLGSDKIKTGLLIITKRLDTGSVWPLSNNPTDRYFYSPAGSNTIANKDYKLWKVVRASTAAPSYFNPEFMDIAFANGKTTQRGQFVDGGVSPHNNPSLQALMYVSMKGHGLEWPLGENRLLLCSVGTGSADANVEIEDIPAKHAIGALQSLMTDCADMVEIMMQWISESPTARSIDRVLGRLDGESLGSVGSLIDYNRFNTSLTKQSLIKLGLKLEKEKIANLSEMDAPENLELLHAIGLLDGHKKINRSRFSANFKLS